MVIDWRQLPEYEPPTLPSLRAAGAALLGATALTLLPTLFVAVALGRDRDVSRAVAILALVTGLILSAAGMWWSVTVTRTIHLLDGRLPSTSRAIRAWLWPVLVFVASTFTVLELSPTEPVDVRALIVGVALALAVWRPCALISRMLRSFTRLNHDALVFGLAVTQLAAWGTLWWLIRTHRSTPPGSQGAATGIALATLVAVGGAVAITAAILRATDEGRSYRILMLQALTDQRHLRSLGLNPFDVRTFQALILARQERERQLRAEQGDDGPALGPMPGGQERPVQPIAFDGSTTEVAAAASRPAAPRRDSSRHEEPPGIDSPSPALFEAATSDDNQIEGTTATNDGGESVAEATAPPTPTGESQDREPEEQRDDGQRDTVAHPVPTPTGTDEAQRPKDDQVDQPVLLGLQALRYLLLLLLAGVEATALWTVAVANDLREPLVDGLLAAGDVGRIDDARTWTTLAVAAALPVQTWWIVMSGGLARLLGTEIEQERHLILATASTALSLTAIVLALADGPGVLLALALFASMLCASVGVLGAGPLTAVIDRRRSFTRTAAIGTAMLVSVHVVSGGASNVPASASVDGIAFVAAILGLVTAMTAIVMGVFSLEVEDALRSSGRLAEALAAERGPSGAVAPDADQPDEAP